MPGLLRGVVRTAAVAGTATAVSNRVSRRQAQRWSEQGTNPYDEPAPQAPAAAARGCRPGRGPDRAAQGARGPETAGHPHGGGVRGAEGEGPRRADLDPPPARAVARRRCSRSPAATLDRDPPCQREDRACRRSEARDDPQLEFLGTLRHPPARRGQLGAQRAPTGRGNARRPAAMSTSFAALTRAAVPVRRAKIRWVSVPGSGAVNTCGPVSAANPRALSALPSRPPKLDRSCVVTSRAAGDDVGGRPEEP